MASLGQTVDPDNSPEHRVKHPLPVGFDDSLNEMSREFLGLVTSPPESVQFLDLADAGVACKLPGPAMCCPLQDLHSLDTIDWAYRRTTSGNIPYLELVSMAPFMLSTVTVSGQWLAKFPSLSQLCGIIPYTVSAHVACSTEQTWEECAGGILSHPRCEEPLNKSAFGASPLLRPWFDLSWITLATSPAEYLGHPSYLGPEKLDMSSDYQYRRSIAQNRRHRAPDCTEQHHDALGRTQQAPCAPHRTEQAPPRTRLHGTAP
ncbi:hypothetical protein RRG08_035147 [Elysia crispata]|uniref:Uncharacterized protein n=1 Tax=Elysia crispata TaxID=231223 RepID=A0AAE1E0F3_9GAST|nr:hypothetical protein RRG08_035147 [Elysia crispata]